MLIFAKSVTLLIVLLLTISCSSDNSTDSTSILPSEVQDCITSTGDSKVNGTVNFLEFVEFTNNTYAVIQLLDDSIADTGAIIISQSCLNKALSTPFDFEIEYNQNQIQSKNSYSVSVYIYQLNENGKYINSYITDVIFPVITQGFGSTVEITVIGI